MNVIQDFCKILRKRSAEHSEAMNRLHDLSGIMASILRQELDSMIRAIYLLSIADISERTRLIEQTLNGEIWTVSTPKGKLKKVTDREMVEQSNKLQGWTLSVYKFGCAFIHFSSFHDYSVSNPFYALSSDEQDDILKHMRYYHGGPLSDNPSFSEIASYFPRVFEKISTNLEHYIKSLELNEVEKIA
ncbi:hypothetical protein [Pleionea mediterranea]|uniref:Uncharacterized protein n=1 Tax=Pleionea mediterranea TaxID=523701 RepID=A0A316FTY1_9GAMM|nr:hypothetical protein [Pleionea mediterranea]PWK51823.1 hypothetical protein C8D97_105138 [Pleionea mediterranea]